MPEDRSVRIHVDLPNHWMVGGEALWADSLGRDLYRLANVPFYAYGLSFRDVVRAIPGSPDQIPEIVEVVEPSGHRTVRVSFESLPDRSAQHDLLESLRSHGATFERATASYVAIDIEPGGDYSAVVAQLDAWSSGGILAFETCEARIDGSFDDEAAAT